MGINVLFAELMQDYEVFVGFFLLFILVARTYFDRY